MKVSYLVLSTVLAGGIALTAAAQTGAPAAGTYGPGTGPHMMRGGMAGAAGMMGQHPMSGTVTKIDHKTGMLTLKTGVGNLQLHFPPSSLEGVKEGDTITVHLAFSKGTATGGAMGAPAGAGTGGAAGTGAGGLGAQPGRDY